MQIQKARTFWPVLLSLVAIDCATKNLAVERLSPGHVPHPVVGELVRFTLAYNPDAAMGLSLGPYSRVGFLLIAAIMICGVGYYYMKAPRESGASVLALALIAGGAAGNLIDRVRSSRGVVDFIDIGVGNARFYTFNVADAGVFCGTLLLLLVLSRRSDKEEVSSPADHSGTQLR
jgi:signal peptidase II